MISFDEALRLIANEARPLGAETVAIGQAAGRRLASPVVAMIDSPPADASAMDGYAVRDVDVPGSLKVVGQSFAGQAPGAIAEAGSCVRIFTGAPVPSGADRVVVQEVVERIGDVAHVAARPGEARHIRRRGSDFRIGDVLLPEGRVLDPRAMVAAAGADVAGVDVWRHPSVLILGTGDELAPPGQARQRPGAIPESVSFGVAALVDQFEGHALGKRRLADDLPAMIAAGEEALERADLVVVTGGASVGERDFARAMFEPHGLDLIFSKVAIKPGKPVWLGRAGRALVMGLPGNPTSALVTARLFLAPLLAGLAGGSPSLEWRKLPLAAPLAATGDRETFHRARLVEGRAFPVSNTDSSAQKALAEADLLVRCRAGDAERPMNSEIEAIDF